MEVTIVDSEPSVVALIDCLDHLPTQPPSIYLDIEGVELCRHGSISIIQVFVLPKNHVFLIDIFVLQEKAFCTSNPSGTTLRSILESALVPKVFFDVRNDSDALFAHFQISLQGIHDIQLFEVATRHFSKKAVTGLVKCIEKDAQLTEEAIVVWKATKQKGVSLFAPENGGSYNVFNARPMLQEIIDYCTQDVVYLPVLWEIYNQRISAQWMRRVQHETYERIRVSHTAGYEPRGKDKYLSPWGQGNRPKKTEARSPENKTVTTVAKIAATEAAEKVAPAKPDAKPHSQPSIKEANLQQSATIAALEVAQVAPKSTTALERPLSNTNITIRSKNDLEGRAQKRLDPVQYPAMVHSKWTCMTCAREMQEGQKGEHLAGKQHIARVRRTAAVKKPSPAKEKAMRATTVTARSSHRAEVTMKPEPRPLIPGKVKATGTNRRKKPTAMSISQQRGLPYPPDHLFVGFEGSVAPRSFQYETAFSLDDVDLNYGLCDKDCGWCGHCLAGVDI